MWLAPSCCSLLNWSSGTDRLHAVSHRASSWAMRCRGCSHTLTYTRAMVWCPIALDKDLKGQRDVGKYFRVGEQMCENSKSLSAVFSLLGICPSACGRDSGRVTSYLQLCGAEQPLGAEGVFREHGEKGRDFMAKEISKTGISSMY